MLYCICFSIITACETEQSSPNLYQPDIPENLQKEMVVPAHNPTTAEGVALGQKLFYDPQLSADNQISCASCHIPSLAFTDGLSLSNKGLSKHQLERHVPQLMNVAWSEGYFWDGGANNLESMVFGPLTHKDEMGQDLNGLLRALNNDAAYTSLFKQAFGIDSIQSAFIARALAQYMRTLVSANSRYDKFVRGEEGGVLTALEKEGMTIVQDKCAACHSFEPGVSDFFTDYAYHNIGLDTVFSDKHERVQMGRFRISFDSTQIGSYKTPTLRNITLTAPYMHDGRFQTLREVLDHYSTNMNNSPYLDSFFLRDQEQVGIPLSEKDKQAILSFLETLKDLTFADQ